MKFRIASRGGRRTSKVGATIGGVLFVGMGGMFLVVLGVALGQTLDRYVTWKPAVATVVSSRLHEAEEDEDPYALSVAVRYTWDGRVFEKPFDEAKTFNDYDDAEAALAAYPQGGEVRVWVDPDAPADVALDRGSLVILPLMLLPLLFVVVGVGLLWFTWRRKRPVATRPDTRGAGRWAAIGLPAFFAVFGIVGATGLYFLGVRPWAQYLDARQWDEVPCVVESSHVRSHNSDDGMTYSIDILYRYEYGGQTYRSNRYSFVGVSSSGHAGKRRVVDQHPPGTETICYVDPGEPDRAVLVRAFTWSLLWGLFFVPFLLVGVVGGIGVWAYRRRQRRRDATTAPRPGARHTQTLRDLDWLPEFRGEGPMELKPQTGRWRKVAGVFGFAAFWNAITGVFVGVAVNSHRAGTPDWFLTLFIIPFVLIGLGAIVVGVHQVLAALNPRLYLHVSNDALGPADTLDLSWKTLGRAARIHRLTVNVVCEESARYQRGTDTITDTDVVQEYRLIDAEALGEIVSGHARFVVPAGAMHSFTASRNEIRWKLRVRGSVRRWPDVTEEYPIAVLPCRPGGAT